MPFVLTRNQLREMKEAELRKVLVDLFGAMGFGDVTETHGATEAGKDLVMWQADSVRGRLYYAVVAKCKRVSGGQRVREVLGQVEECFGAPFTDPVTLEKRRVERVIIVTSKEVTKEAKDQLSRQLETHRLLGQVDLVDGDTLFQRIKEYLPKTVLWEVLTAAQRELDAAGKQTAGLRYGLQIGPEGSPAVHIFPKDLADDHPIKFSLGMNFPKTTDGIAASQAWADFLATGRPTSIAGEYIRELKVPEALESLVGEAKVEVVRFDAAPLDKHLHIAVHLLKEGKPVRSLPHVCLTHQRGGTEEASLDNRGQGIPLRVRLVLPKGDQKKVDFGISHDEPENVYQYYQCLLLLKALATSDQMLFSNYSTGVVIAEGRINGNTFKEPTETELEVFSRLALIQARTGEILSVPSAFSKDCFPDIIEASDAISQGFMTIPQFTLSFDGGTEELSGMIGKVVTLGPLLHESDRKVSVANTTISLGQQYVLVQGILRNNQDRKLPHRFMLESRADLLAVALYPKWKPTILREMDRQIRKVRGD